MSVRVLIADDHALVRAGVRGLLAAAPELEVVGEAADGAEALRLTREHQPHVLVLDLNMPGLDGFEVLRRVRIEVPGVRVLVLTLDDDPRSVQRAVRDGADGYVLKDAIAQDLIAAVRRVATGGGAFDGGAQNALRDAARGESEDPLERLTAREREVLRRIAEGLANKEIASALHIGVRTVETHRANLLRKLAMRSTAELTRFAIEQGLFKG